MKRATTLVGVCALLMVLCASGEDVTLTARVSLTNQSGKASRELKAGNVVFWLTPAEGAGHLTGASFPEQHPRLVQMNKSFQPHILIVPVGSVVQFPNHDPFFHNVFSLFEGKRFDLGLYEAGTTRDVRFDKPGVSYIFCNIHPQMSAVVLALDTPYYGVSDQKGQVVIPNVPAGRYMLHIWYESALPDTLKGLSRDVTVSASNGTLGVFRLVADEVSQTHKNKYGRDYETPTPAQNPAYNQP